MFLLKTIYRSYRTQYTVIVVEAYCTGYDSYSYNYTNYTVCMCVTVSLITGMRWIVISDFFNGAI